MSTISSGTTLTTALVQTGDTTGELVIKTNNGNTTAATFTTAGNVGIGTSSAGEKLQVNGNIKQVGSGAVIYQTDNTNTAFWGLNPIAISNSFGVSTGQSIPFIVANANTERMRIDSSGNVGIGTSSPATKLDVGGAITDTVPATYKGTIRVNSATQTTVESVGGIEFPVAFDGYGYKIQQISSSGACLAFAGRQGSATWTERMRIDSSGNLLVGTTDASTGANSDGVYINNEGAIISRRATAQNLILRRWSSNGIVADFRNTANTGVGSIATAASSTSYNTSSDYRLKENIAPMTGALARVAQLKPVTYSWKVDGSAGEGFIAHELAEVVPDCVTGEKDAVDAEGNPVYQGIDTSFLVATLTAAIKEQQAIINEQASTIAAFEARLSALEAK